MQATCRSALARRDFVQLRDMLNGGGAVQMLADHCGDAQLVLGSPLTSLTLRGTGLRRGDLAALCRALCAVARYQSELGEPACRECPHGRFNPNTGSHRQRTRHYNHQRNRRGYHNTTSGHTTNT